MKRLLLFLPLAIFILMGAFFLRGLELDPSARESALIGQPLPDFRLPTLENPQRYISKADLQGQVVLLNVWGSWCPSCYQEHPSLLKAAHEYQIPVIGLNYKDEEAAAKVYLQKQGNPYAFNLVEREGERKLAFDLGVYGAPETFIVDAQGVVRYHLAGVLTDAILQQEILPKVRQWQN
ncbi:cytochrome c biogenesis protein CcmG, thiol:disulfide interchange protein DsbE [Allopseudospirillum japonicum]|uniref:Cytochrome c biogenesis protein CcmG, thiol:disulfide interchange protein DsbE n=1 Tax=Allopseudospirillum japonicum TaxID=64971 RepID=A0A1H6QZ48_9GAMM|nr:DsbE family thiol:disulfide interchange protein [Allopseudospirillum japonicum]SEI46254.1 cytochrome c biogenesis protein CcmG, thiol:disulfide interchange protein DsbE [Allopseudospirillum japonicum]